MDIISFGLASKVSKAIEALIGDSKITIPSGTTAERPTLGVGDKAIRFNTDTSGLEEWDGTEWKNISAAISAFALKGTDTAANILAMVGMAAEDLWIASDTLDGYVYDGSVWINLGPLKGDTGATGLQGIQGITGNGIASVALTNTVGNTKTYTITFTDTSTTTFDVVDGVNGQDVDHMSRTSGTGAAGTTDTYTVWLGAGETISAGTFTVYNGADGLGSGDMLKVIYDPTNINASVFDVDNHISGTTNKVYTATEQTKLSGIAEGAQVNDANTTLQGNTFNGVSQLVKLDGTGKLPAIDGSLLTGLSSGVTDHTLLTNIGTRTHAQLESDIAGKQATLVSGTNIKTVGGSSILGSGDIVTVDSTKLPLTGGTMTGAVTSFRETKIAMGADDINLASGNLFTKTISTATTLTMSNKPASGQVISFILELTNAGSAVITWFSGVKWAGGTAPTLTTAGKDILGCYSHDGGLTWNVLVLGKDVK